MPTHWVLDHNFPWHASTFPWPPFIRISRLADLDGRLIKGYEDWQVLLELGKRGDVDGFITNDDDMLELPLEMVALTRTSLTLLIAKSAGHEVLRSTGLVLAHLEEVAKRVDGRPQIYVVKTGALVRQRPGERLNVIAEHRNARANELHTAAGRQIETYLSAGNP